MKKIRRGDKLSLCQKSFTEDTANKIGLSQRTIQHEVQIAEKIDNEIKDKIRNTELADNKKELLLLARLGENILIEVKIEGSVETKPRNKIETIWKKQNKKRNNYLNASSFSKLPRIYCFNYLEQKHLLCFLKCFFLQCHFKNQYKEETNYETKLREI
jgi:hypothetical protein